MNTKTSWLTYIPYLFLALLFILLFCSATSPLFLNYGVDSSIFLTMGRLFIEGKVPFVDFFDHKGPVIILIEAFSQLLAPYRLGLFILEVINLFLVIILIDRICKLLSLDWKMTLITVCSFLVLCYYSLNSGNTTEEHSLLPLFIALYITLKYYYKSHKLKASESFIIGLCFSFIFWLRVNNSGALCGMCLFIVIDYLIKKDYKSIKSFILYFLAGQLPLSILFLGYFGYHNAIYELFYATFLFNFKYIQSASISSLMLVSVIVILITIIGLILEYRRNKEKRIFLLTLPILISSVIVTNMGHIFNHYLILLAPALILSIALVLRNTNRLKKYIVVLSCIFFTAFFIQKTYFVITRISYFENEYTGYKDSGIEILSNIPSKEKDDIFYYQVAPKFYPIFRISPNYKYFVLQEWHGHHDENIYYEINKIVQNTRPCWILIEKSERSFWITMANGSNKVLQTQFEELYSVYDENEIFLLLVKNGKDGIISNSFEIQ